MRASTSMGGFDPVVASLVSAVPSLTVGAVMERSPLRVAASEPLEAALWLLAEEGATLAVVVDDDDDLVGVLDAGEAELALDRSFDADRALRRVRAWLGDFAGDSFHVESTLTVADAMRPYVHVARPSWSPARALGVMIARGVDALPVVEEGDCRVVGLVRRRRLEKQGVRATPAPRTEPLGTFRDALALPCNLPGADRLEAMERVETVARRWVIARVVDPEAPSAVTFAGAALPVLSALYDDLVEHYARFEVGEDRPELSRRLEALREAQQAALADLRAAMSRIRQERRPERESLERLAALIERLREIDEAEGDLLHEACRVDVPALD